jgi:hypothetical protein
MSIEERSRRIDEYCARMKKISDEEKAKLPTKEWILEKNEREELQKRQDLITEKGFEVGQNVFITSINMNGKIVEINRRPCRTPIVIKREDGETFGYNPYEVDLISKNKK